MRKAHLLAGATAAVVMMAGSAFAGPLDSSFGNTVTWTGQDGAKTVFWINNDGTMTVKEGDAAGRPAAWTLADGQFCGVYEGETEKHCVAMPDVEHAVGDKFEAVGPDSKPITVEITAGQTGM